MKFEFCVRKEIIEIRLDTTGISSIVRCNYPDIFIEKSNLFKTDCLFIKTDLSQDAVNMLVLVGYTNKVWNANTKNLNGPRNYGPNYITYTFLLECMNSNDKILEGVLKTINKCEKEAAISIYENLKPLNDILHSTNIRLY